MKKIALLVFTMFLGTLALNAQVAEGSILYTMQVEGLPAEQAAMFGDMDLRNTFKNGKVLTEMNSMMGSTQILVDDKNVLMLIDQMGNKMAINQTKEEAEKENAKSKDKQADPKIEYTTETKTIAGYECKKAIITLVDKNNKEEKIDMWYSDKFANPNIDGKGRGQHMMKGLKGMPFEYVGSYGPMKTKITAKEVSEAPVADEKFKLSTDGYKLMTTQELKAVMGGK